MKKIYIQPDVQVIALKIENLLQTGSPKLTVTGLDEDFKGNGGDGNENDEADARGFFGFWGPEELGDE